MVGYHTPVLLEEVLHYIEPKNKRLIVDGTLGDGGHTQAMLDAGPTLRVLGIDRDTEALERARQRLATYKERVILVHGSFSEVKSILARQNERAMDGILLDFGVSSRQLDVAERGFSFRFDGPLDMRMDRSQEGPTAADLLETLSDFELEQIFRKYGEEKRPRQLVRLIRKAQGSHPIKTTFELSQILSSAAKPSRKPRIHPATKAFQALRIAVNRELDHIQKALEDAIDCLAPGGRMVVISFHSLEDRIVKDFFRTEAKGCICPPKAPVCVCGRKSRLKVLTRRVVKPSTLEVERNPRASSAKLRAAERIHD
ncbi:S-adenosyl-L-methionine-dependent methyltransferase mraW [Nitrospina gracilis 3/211]|uniref:Ribosomal RNA small subunit methyltransferase H n=1 Tax=Nitrospina gracilis (strain 3/211) TaxID=1266370 RepID=M1Z8K6_NITG3|nr:MULTISPECIES: 16S rRNA (cytosine(1402)-N(4))-methyltransferase RsmH [Nitrospina]MCF8722177.1 16S rRNA (cytosine1402-N4)-methyltransferase [Nitrospina sp. Nb-3]CCQ89370.1 S-adenosyl-L-methionine-dependent methyltransferase mraW [Nitrospina gracilis 3/211]